MISIITVVNNFSIYEKYLLPSISIQKNVSYEIHVIDNSNNKYKSLTEAYNSVLGKVNGEWVLFCHPDICFLSENSIKKIVEKVESINKKDSEYVIFGGAGASNEYPPRNFMSFKHGLDNLGGKDTNFDYYDAQTVDACCYMILKSVCKDLKFSTYLTGFHMAIEDLCIRAISAGKKVAVIPFDIWHLSTGNSLNSTYYREMRKVFKKNVNLLFLNTTSFSFYRRWYTMGLLMFYEIRNKIHHLFD